MKNLICLFLLGMLLANTPVEAQKALAIAESSTIKAMKTSELISWDNTRFDFGEIPQNVPASATFVFINESDQPLILTKVKGSCGCTATEYETEPIAPGESSKIVATYNAKKVGQFTKQVTVNTNLTKEPVVLQLAGNVLAE